MVRLGASIAAVGSVLLLAAPGLAAEFTKCRLTYSIKGWSVFYERSDGSGRITCSNGQQAAVRIVAHGGGVTFGTHEGINGKGVFSAVRGIDELFGTYVEVTAHGGAGTAGDSRFMLKGSANLSLAGTGQGINLGIAFGSFRIEPG